MRIVLAAGADFTAHCVLRAGVGRTPEDSVRATLSSLRLHEEEDEEFYHNYVIERIAIYEETLSILEGVRLAGSYKQYVLRDFKELLRTRSLLARGRAFMGPKTHEVVARLFGGSTARTRPPTRRHRPLERAAGVPDPAFWLVMEYWRLGDWRRPSE